MPRVYTEPFVLNEWKAHRIGCGPLKIALVPSLGGRIISLRFEGKEFLFLNKESTFPLWGGDKTWIAPQGEWPEGKPYTELDSSEYELTWDGQQAIMTSPVCSQTGLRIVRKVKIDEEMTLHLVEEMHNATTDRVIQKGIWNVTQVNRPCTVFIPAQKGAIRSYHLDDKTLPDVKDIYSEKDGWVEIPCRTQTLFKCGGIPKEGHIIIKLPLGGPKEVVWLKTFALDTQASYAHASAVEVFNSNTANYAEVEIHSPLTTLNPGEFCTLTQEWRFKKI